MNIKKLFYVSAICAVSVFQATAQIGGFPPAPGCEGNPCSFACLTEESPAICDYTFNSIGSDKLFEENNGNKVIFSEFDEYGALQFSEIKNKKGTRRHLNFTSHVSGKRVSIVLSQPLNLEELKGGHTSKNNTLPFTLELNTENGQVYFDNSGVYVITSNDFIQFPHESLSNKNVTKQLNKKIAQVIPGDILLELSEFMAYHGMSVENLGLLNSSINNKGVLSCFAALGSLAAANVVLAAALAGTPLTAGAAAPTVPAALGLVIAAGAWVDSACTSDSIGDE